MGTLISMQLQLQLQWCRMITKKIPKKCISIISISKHFPVQPESHQLINKNNSKCCHRYASPPSEKYAFAISQVVTQHDTHKTNSNNNFRFRITCDIPFNSILFIIRYFWCKILHRAQSVHCMCAIHGWNVNILCKLAANHCVRGAA